MNIDFHFYLAVWEGRCLGQWFVVLYGKWVFKIISWRYRTSIFHTKAPFISLIWTKRSLPGNRSHRLLTDNHQVLRQRSTEEIRNPAGTENYLIADTGTLVLVCSSLLSIQPDVFTTCVCCWNIVCLISLLSALPSHHHQPGVVTWAKYGEILYQLVAFPFLSSVWKYLIVRR